MEGLHICITGKLSTGTRNEIEETINKVGATLDKSVTYNTDYLVTNDDTTGSTKLKLAKRYGTKIISERELMILLLKRLGNN